MYWQDCGSFGFFCTTKFFLLFLILGIIFTGRSIECCRHKSGGTYLQTLYSRFPAEFNSYTCDSSASGKNLTYLKVPFSFLPMYTRTNKFVDWKEKKRLISMLEVYFSDNIFPDLILMCLVVSGPLWSCDLYERWTFLWARNLQ